MVEPSSATILFFVQGVSGKECRTGSADCRRPSAPKLGSSFSVLLIQSGQIEGTGLLSAAGRPRAFSTCLPHLVFDLASTNFIAHHEELCFSNRQAPKKSSRLVHRTSSACWSAPAREIHPIVETKFIGNRCQASEARPSAEEVPNCKKASASAPQSTGCSGGTRGTRTPGYYPAPLCGAPARRNKRVSRQKLVSVSEQS
jgi:hypothetical protein